MSAQGAAKAPKPRPMRFVLAGVAILAAVAILVSLGNWQMRRLAWKEALIEKVAERPDMPPLPAAAILAPGAAENEYRRVELAGRYLAADEVRVFTSLPVDEARGPASGPGAWIMTPFALQGGGTVLVNRGFVPDGAQWAPPPQGTTRLSGLVRPDDPPTFLTPESQLQDDLFFSRSISAIAEAKGLAAPVAPVTIDLLPAGNAPDLPQAGETRMRFPNRHLEYALTWYGLALALVAVFSAYALSSWRRR